MDERVEILRKPFEHGVYGVLHVDWTLKLETPLTIHNGQKTAYKQQDPTMKKGRGKDRDVNWTQALKKLDKRIKEKEGWSEVADFNYHFEIEDNQVVPQYAIPSSSIRGTLRNAAITSFIEREDWQCFNLPKKPEKHDDAALAERKRKIDNALKHLQNQQSGWYDVLSLFGLVFELEEKQQQPLVWAGRLRLTVAPLESKSGEIDGKYYADGGPDNLKRHITVRNPLDRVTSAAKEGGLHFKIEMSEGQGFQVHCEILNPRQTDIELLEAWRDDINAGYLRFGALTSQGRGRTIIAHETHTLYLRTNRPQAAQLDDLDKSDLFYGIWKSKQLSLAKLKHFELS